MMASEDTVWYFAYGSNMSSDKFSNSRGIKPIRTARASIPGWTLTTEIPGTPYTEPAYTSIRPILGTDVKARSVVGVAYLVTAEQYVALVASEGGGIAYADIALPAVPVTEEDEKATGPQLTVRTLGTIMKRDPPAAPSQRYMDLILDGAAEASLPDDYRQYLQNIPIYQPPRNVRRLLGAYLFLAFWTPVMHVMEKMTMASLGSNGNVPAGVAQVVRFVVYLMWAYHDCIHAPIWGRGDGMDG